jgi:hypothetical protein
MSARLPAGALAIDAKVHAEIEALPQTESDFRARLLKTATHLFDYVRRNAGGTVDGGGYMLAGDAREQIDAHLNAALALLEQTPVHFWPEFRDATHRSIRRRARRLSPEFAGFMDKLEGGNA